MVGGLSFVWRSVVRSQYRLFWRSHPRSSGKCQAESGRAPERAPASFQAGSERRSEEFEYKIIRFPDNFELGRSWTELGGAERSSAEPEPSSAEHFPIAHFWTQASNGFQWILWSQDRRQTDGSQPEWRSSGAQNCHSGHKSRDRRPTQKDSDSASSN